MKGERIIVYGGLIDFHSEMCVFNIYINTKGIFEILIKVEQEKMVIKKLTLNTLATMQVPRLAAGGQVEEVQLTLISTHTCTHTQDKHTCTCGVCVAGGCV